MRDPKEFSSSVHQRSNVVQDLSPDLLIVCVPRTDSGMRDDCDIRGKNWSAGLPGHHRYQLSKGSTCFIANDVMMSNNIRNQVIQELILSEERYVNDLQVLVQVFVRPVINERLVPKEEVSHLFGNVEQLLPINEELLKGLKSAPIDEIRVGQVFIERSPLLKRYAFFCSSQHDILPRLRRLRKEYPKFDAFLMEAEKTPECKDHDIMDYLISPMQRITRYPLLLKKILENTETTDPDYTAIVDSLEGANHVCTVANQSATRSAQVQQIRELSATFSAKDAEQLDLLSSHTRKIVRRGTCFVRKSKEKELQIVLMDDMILLYIQREGEHNKIYKRITLHTEDSEEEDIPYIVEPRSTAKDEISVQIHSSSGLSERLYFRNAEETLHWYAILCKHMPYSKMKKNRSRSNYEEEKKEVLHKSANKIPTLNLQPARPLRSSLGNLRTPRSPTSPRLSPRMPSSPRHSPRLARKVANNLYARRPNFYNESKDMQTMLESPNVAHDRSPTIHLSEHTNVDVSMLEERLRRAECRAQDLTAENHTYREEHSTLKCRCTVLEEHNASLQMKVLALTDTEESLRRRVEQLEAELNEREEVQPNVVFEEKKKNGTKEKPQFARSSSKSIIKFFENLKS
ncbi:hypothetical protein PROFUN_13445 [Planoprotostelium fungivorum]|uniref:DH domain-containing protein n=1 Tax=Planoprotostelium fungivorum TaxID=1890364 RepID=A0A2P6N441_9EUKA|nr:hypothetical protein PROFUN_13445 [Planoprotostelium fungivorum]